MLHEEEQLAQAAVLDEFSLDFDAVEQHRSQSDDDHLLINLVDLSQGFQDSRQDLVLDDLLLAILLYGHI